MIYLSVVIPVRNEERFIASTLEALIAQEYPRERFELIVVDGRSTDDTVEVVERVMRANPGVNITLLDNPRRWSSVARNIGAKHASGKIVAVVDGHVNIPGRELFSSIERAREEKGALCLARPAPLDRSITPESKGYWIALARKNRLGHSGASYIYSDFEGMVDPLSSGFAYDRELFEQVGYFDESFDAAEDVEFHQRLKAAGVMAYTSPSLSIPYFPRESLHGLFRQMWRYGLGRFRLCRKFPAALSPETLVPPAFLLGLVFWIASLLLAPGSTVAVALSLIYLLYFGIVGYEAFREVGERARGKTLFVMTALFVIHAGLGAGFLMGAAEWARDRYKVPLKDEGEKMKVAFVIDRIDSTTAGTERHLTDLIQNLDKGRFVPVLCLLQETEWSRGYQGCGTHIIGVSSFLKPSTYMRILSFARFLRRERVDIVQSYFADGNKVGIIASFLAGVRARVSMRRNQGYWHTRAERAWLKLINPFATLFLANSEGTRQWAAETEGIPIEKIGVIYNGLELGLFSYAGARARSELRSQWGVADSEYVVGIVANLRPVKRIDVFLEAAARVASKVENVRFVIAGEGSERTSLEEKVNSLRISDKVLFLGSVENAAPILCGFDVGVLSSDSESFSNSVVEYMAASLPVVATDVGGLSEAIIEGESGFLVPAGDPESMAAAIINVLSGGRSASLGERGREIATERFGLEKITAEYEALYQSILRGGGENSAGVHRAS